MGVGEQSRVANRLAVKIGWSLQIYHQFPQPVALTRANEGQLYRNLKLSDRGEDLRHSFFSLFHTPMNAQVVLKNDRTTLGEMQQDNVALESNTSH